MIPGIDEDVVTYFAIVRTANDPTFAAGDFPLRAESAAGLPGYTAAFGFLEQVMGFDAAAFALTWLGTMAIIAGMWRMSRAAGATLGSATTAITAALVLYWGSFAFLVSVPSHGQFSPTPRFLGIAIAVLAIAMAVEGRPWGAAALGVIASSVHALDGLIPPIAGLSAVLVARAFERTREGQRGPDSMSASGKGKIAVLVCGLIVANHALSNILQLPVLPKDLSFLWIGLSLAAVLWQAGDAHAPHNRRVSSLAAALGALVAAGSWFLMRRGSTESAILVESRFFDGVAQFEKILLQASNPSMTPFNMQGGWGAPMVMVLGIITTVLLVAPRNSDVPTSEQEARRRLATLSMLLLVGLGLAGMLQERTELVGIMALWPNRHAWAIIPGALVAVALRTPRRWDLGVLPVGLVGLVILSERPFRVALAVALVVSGVVLVVRELAGARTARLSMDASLGVRPRQVVRGILPVRTILAAAALPVAVVLLIVRIPAPALTLDDSRAWFLTGGSAVAELATFAAGLPESTRVLIPPDAGWGAFRILSGRGVAFDAKQFSSDAAAWYEAFRWMCDPDYTFQSREDYYRPTRGEISSCYASLDAALLSEVAARFGATHAVVRTGQWGAADRLAATSDGVYELVRVP